MEKTKKISSNKMQRKPFNISLAQTTKTVPFPNKMEKINISSSEQELNNFLARILARG